MDGDQTNEVWFRKEDMAEGGRILNMAGIRFLNTPEWIVTHAGFFTASGTSREAIQAVLLASLPKG